MSRPPRFRCHRCQKVVSQFEEVREVIFTASINWKDRKLNVSDDPESNEPVKIMARCECGNYWRLQRVASLDGLRCKFELHGKDS